MVMIVQALSGSVGAAVKCFNVFFTTLGSNLGGRCAEAIEKTGFLLTCTAGDYNLDSNLDLACASQDLSNAQPAYPTFLGNGDGTFQRPQFHS
jgi:hypothetical protein